MVSGKEAWIVDRRVNRTRKLLLQALMSLISKDAWAGISIRSICDEADIARSTFYTHFNNKHELLDFGFASLEGEISEMAEDRSLNLNGKFGFLPGLVEHIQSHAVLFANLSTSPNGSLVFNRFKTLIEQSTNVELAAADLGKQLDSDEVAYIAGGIFAVIEKWNRDGCKQSTALTVMKIDQLVTSSFGLQSANRNSK